MMYKPSAEEVYNTARAAGLTYANALHLRDSTKLLFNSDHWIITNYKAEIKVEPEHALVLLADAAKKQMGTCFHGTVLCAGVTSHDPQGWRARFATKDGVFHSSDFHYEENMAVLAACTTWRNTP